MNGLNLPTDNLYKFVAIAGVSMTLFSIYLMFTRVEMGSTIRNQLDLEDRLIEVEEKQIEEAWKKLKQTTGPEAKALEKARDDIAKRKARLGENALAATRYLETNFAIIKALQVTHFGGYVIGGFGFFLWYFKVQRYLDKALSTNSGDPQSIAT